MAGHRYIELFLMSTPSSGGELGREGGDRGMPRGGGGVARYPAQTSWTDPRGTQVWMYMYYTCTHVHVYIHTCIYMSLCVLIMHNVQCTHAHVHVVIQCMSMVCGCQSV